MFESQTLAGHFHIPGIAPCQCKRLDDHLDYGGQPFLPADCRVGLNGLAGRTFVG